MYWRDEEPRKFNQEKAIKKYIKSELMNYYLYLSKYYELMDEKYRYYHRSVGGSVIVMPSGSSVSGDGLQHRAVMHESEVAMRQDVFVEKLERIDGWMNILTDSQHDVVRVYVMQFQCENAHKAANILRYEEDTVKKYAVRAIHRIYTNIHPIL